MKRKPMPIYKMFKDADEFEAYYKLIDQAAALHNDPLLRYPILVEVQVNFIIRDSDDILAIMDATEAYAVRIDEDGAKQNGGTK